MFTNIPTPGSSGFVPVVSKNSPGDGDAICGFNAPLDVGLLGGGGGTGEVARDPPDGERRPPADEPGDDASSVPESGVRWLCPSRDVGLRGPLSLPPGGMLPALTDLLWVAAVDPSLLVVAELFLLSRTAREDARGGWSCELESPGPSTAEGCTGVAERSESDVADIGKSGIRWILSISSIL